MNNNTFRTTLSSGKKIIYSRNTMGGLDVISGGEKKSYMDNGKTLIKISSISEDDFSNLWNKSQDLLSATGDDRVPYYT